MIQEEILEGDELIAEFMGLEFTGKQGIYFLKPNRKLPNKLNYHSSWDWLMPVVEKIRDKNCFVHVYFPRKLNVTTCEIHNMEFLEKNFDIKKTGQGVTPIFEACVEFIKWYNQKIK